MDKIGGCSDATMHLGVKTAESDKNIERAMRIHAASVERETDSVSSSIEESVNAVDMTTEENGFGTSRLLERIGQFASKDVFYVDELLVPIVDGEEMHSRQHLNSIFAINMDGSIKLPLLVFGDCILQNTLQEMGELPVVYSKQKRPLSTQEALLQWLHMVDHMFTRVDKEVLMIIREATVGGSVQILQTKFTSLALLILPTKEHSIEKSLKQGITETLRANYDYVVGQQPQVAPGLKESVFTLYRCWKEELKSSTIWNCFVDAGLIASKKYQSPSDPESNSDCSYSDCGSSSSAYDIWNLGDEDIEVLDMDSEDDLQRISDAEIETRSTHTTEDDASIVHPPNLPSEPEIKAMLQSSELKETVTDQIDLALDIVYRRLLQMKGVSASVFEKFFKLEHFVKQQRTSGKDCVRRGPSDEVAAMITQTECT
ncbi:tigger transposable element-derived protein 4-like [Anopheles albimanus]|uniref:tigger transposable element-derived protein 4-like n=1 Tax=Anopheles albimanus TaxID=7167 RepID=UPI00163E8B83|nr:tigger transposable element-derived protein 4-like [Anopheles albimanus]